MTSFLPPTILQLFAPRPPLPYLPPKEKAPPIQYTGLASYVSQFEDPNTVQIAPWTPPESYIQRKMRKERTRNEKHDKKLHAEMTSWDPNNDAKIKGDPNHTLFVGRLSYKTTEEDLQKEFDQYGTIKRIRIVRDTATGKSKGYAFIEFEHSSDMKSACKYANGKRLDGRRMLVDTERGRLQKGWRPRRLGGGLGGESRSKNAPPPQQQQQSSSHSSHHHHHHDNDNDSHRGHDRYKPYDREGYKSGRGSGGFHNNGGGKPGIGYGRPPRNFDGDSRPPRSFNDSDSARPRYEGPPRPSYDDQDSRPRYGYQ